MKRVENSLDTKQVLTVVEKYSQALELLDAYDHQNMSRIDDHTLVALTIMIAESKPEEKEMMVSVIMNCINGYD